MNGTSSSIPKLGTYTEPPSNQHQPLIIWKPKGYLKSFSLILTLLLALFVLLMMLARMLALPGMQLADWPVLRELGQFGVLLNNSLSLAWVPVSDRNTVIYLLVLPTAALLISIFRLTLGLRVLGYRAVLIAVGFNEIGILPSLLVIFIVLGTVIAVRPSIRQARLPLYARVSIILSITACILVSALFLGSWLRSEWIWSLAFFPVIILAMMAEAVSETTERENLPSAAWRLFWTIVIALILKVQMQSHTIVNILLHFPELMLLQLISILFVSEYFDLRLFQGWQSTKLGGKIHGLLYKSTEEIHRLPRVAVIRNRSLSGTIGHLGPAAPESRSDSIQHLVDALRYEGYNVKIIEGDRLLLRELRNFLLPHPRSGVPGGVALNLSTGIQGYGRHLHVPAMLEMAGIAYTGPNPSVHARIQDRFTLFSLLQQAGVSVPSFHLLQADEMLPIGMTFPVFVLPRSDADAAVSVKNPKELANTINQIKSNYGSEIVIQARVSGLEFRVAIFGNQELECLPLLQIDSVNQQRECPALISDTLADRIRNYACNAYRIAGCRDYARIDLRLGDDGKLYVIAIHTQDIFARKGSLANMIEAEGLKWNNVLRHIIELAAARTGAEIATKLPPAPQETIPIDTITVVDTQNIVTGSTKVS